MDPTILAACLLCALAGFLVARSLALKSPPPPQTDAAAIVAALVESQRARDEAFFAAGRGVIDSAMIQMQGSMTMLRNTQVVGGVPLELEMERTKLELAKQNHVRKMHEEQFEAFKASQTAGMIPRTAQPPARPHPLT